MKRQNDAHSHRKNGTRRHVQNGKMALKIIIQTVKQLSRQRNGKTAILVIEEMEKRPS